MGTLNEIPHVNMHIQLVYGFRHTVSLVNWLFGFYLANDNLHSNFLNYEDSIRSSADF